MGIATEYVIEISEDFAEETQTYGPYTRKQAETTLRQVERRIESEARLMDDDPKIKACIVRLCRWQRPEPLKPQPKRPLCSACGQKMDVWTSEFGNRETHAQCNNHDCENCQGGGEVVAVDGYWRFVEHVEEAKS